MPGNSGALEVRLQFIYKRKSYACIGFIDTSDQPCYIFVVLEDKDLISEFGDEISIKTDFEQQLPRKDDYPALVELRQSILDACKNTQAIQRLRAGRSLENTEGQYTSA